MSPIQAGSSVHQHERANTDLWAHGDLAKLVRAYEGRRLRPVETMVLVRHREALSGRVLELGCGAGRLTGYLIAIASAVHGLDVSPAMIESCRRQYPAGSFEEGDLRDLSRFADGSFDAVVAGFNVLDVLSDDERGRVLDEIGRVLTPGGALVLSTHNRGHAAHVRGPLHVRAPRLRTTVANVVRLPRRLRNRRRLGLLTHHQQPGYAVLNDSAHDYATLHYYIARDDQQRQLAAHGFELLECLDLDGAVVPDGGTAAYCSELHYVARRAR